MKKVFLSIITLIYLGLSTGLAMELHYCMGKLTGTDLYEAKEHAACGKCGMKNKQHGCCKDEQHFLKLSDAHKLIQNDFAVPAHVAMIPQGFTLAGPSILPLSNILYPTGTAPPGDTGPSIFILNCNFRL